MNKEKKDNIYKYTKRHYLLMRNESVSSEDSYFSIKDQETRNNVKDRFMGFYCQSIALLIFLDTYLYNPNFIEDGFQIDDSIMANYQVINTDYDMSVGNIYYNNDDLANIINNFNEIVSKFYPVTSALDFSKAYILADTKLRPRLNIQPTVDEAITKEFK